MAKKVRNTAARGRKAEIGGRLSNLRAELESADSAKQAAQRALDDAVNAAVGGGRELDDATFERLDGAVKAAEGRARKARTLASAAERQIADMAGAVAAEEAQSAVEDADEWLDEHCAPALAALIVSYNKTCAAIAAYRSAHANHQALTNHVESRHPEMRGYVRTLTPAGDFERYLQIGIPAYEPRAPWTPVDIRKFVK